MFIIIFNILKNKLIRKFNFSIVGALSKRENTIQKLAYAAICGVHTVFFSKRRKNSSLCAHHAAACFVTAGTRPLI